MKRIAVFLVLAVALVAFTTVPPQRPGLPETPVVFSDMVEALLPAVVYIEARGPYGSWSGSGVCVSPDGIILTARHVVEDAEQFLVRFPDGREFGTRDAFVHKSIDFDAAFVHIGIDNAPFVSEFAVRDHLRVGQDVWIVGCPFGSELAFTVTRGIVSHTSRDISFFGTKLMIQADAQAWPGNSGGPVFDMQGRIIGILVGGMRGADGISLITSGDACAGLLAVYLEHLEHLALMQVE